MKKHWFILMMALTTCLFSQERSDLYYFSVTGDTLLFPDYSYGDSTFLSVSVFAGNKETKLETVPVAGFDVYTVPPEILKKYNLSVKGTEIKSDEKIIDVKETIRKNEQIGFSLNKVDYLFRLKLRLEIFYKQKKVVTIKTTEDYDAAKKQSFSKESFIVPVIVKMDSKEVYFVMLWLRKKHPDMGMRWREMLSDFQKPNSYYDRFIFK